jgi:predicted alpha/beta hydrolase family esterase
MTDSAKAWPADPPILIVPGLGGSGPDHWQTIWQRHVPNARRVMQDDWDRPDRDIWLDSLRAAVVRSPGAVLVAHSLGCALVAHLVKRNPELAIAGALLVAPADVERRSCTPTRVRGFAPMPLPVFDFPAVVVTSANDPCVSLDRARLFAERWAARFVNVGCKGHINVAASCGPWPEGQTILRHLLETIAANAASGHPIVRRHVAEPGQSTGR